MDKRRFTVAYRYKAMVCALAVTLLGSSGAQAHSEDDPLIGSVLVDQMERRLGDDENSLVLEGQAWIGRDLNKLWLKVDFEETRGETEEAELQALYSRAIASYWDVQVGVRRDIETGPARYSGVIGIQGLAPYFFETDLALFVGESGRTAARIEAEYEVLLTQRWILTPEIEANFYGQSEEAALIGSGLSDISAGLRLRYEIRREFAPYVGVNWERKFGNTADLARVADKAVSDRQWVLGLRAWF